MSGPAPRQLSIYPEWRTSLHGLGLLVFSGCAIAMLVKGLGASPQNGEYVFGGIFLAVLTAGGLAVFIERRRPIAFSDDGIEALLADRVWRRLAWRDIDRIEKRHVPAYEDRPAEDMLRFVSGRRSITVSSRIEKFAALKELVNREVERRSIDVVAIEGAGRKATITPLDRI